jgi:hypothetical protein
MVVSVVRNKFCQLEDFACALSCKTLALFNQLIFEEQVLCPSTPFDKYTSVWTIVYQFSVSAMTASCV